MTWKRRAWMFALGWLIAAVPAVGVAQDKEESGASAEQKESESSESESSKGDETSGSESEADSSKSSGSDQSKSSKSDNQSANNKKQGSASASDSASSKGATSGETPEEGPGGKKLRQDYPGTEKSKQKQMETDRIEGLQFKEGQEPGKAYDVKIQQLETKVDDLKEKVFQSKSRVVLLKETVLGGNLSGSRAMIVHANDLGGKFKLVRAMYSLDGNRVFDETRDSGDKLKRKKFRVYDGSISGGAHNVSILLEYQGSGYGVFNYMKGYNMKITSSCQFDVKPGKATILRVRTIKKGGAFKDAAQNPGVKCEIQTTDVSKKKLKGTKKSKGASSGGSSKSSGTGGSK